MKNYPKWFYPSFEPRKPTPPVAMQTLYDEVARVFMDQYCSFAIPEITGATHIRIDDIKYNSYDGCMGDIVLIFSKERTVDVSDTPNYQKLLKLYEKDMRAYEKQMAEWKELKARYDKEQEAKLLKYKKNMYAKLKKEFEK